MFDESKILEIMGERLFAEEIDWNAYSNVVIVAFALLQALRWVILPQFLDMYYHLLTAWGFVKAGGYPAWDFWSCAPLGRPHIYPPLFHILIASLFKLGVDKIFLAKFFESVTPVIFLLVLSFFIKRNFGSRLSFFVLLSAGASFSFYLSLMNNIPATLALILGFCAFDQIFKDKLLRAAILLSLCFYTHIGVSWFLLLAVILYAVVNPGRRRLCIRAACTAVLLAAPLLLQQLFNAQFISLEGIEQKMGLEFKPIEYLIAVVGLWLLRRKPLSYALFLCLTFAGFIFLKYQYRFFCAQGYLPVVFLTAVAFDSFYGKCETKSKGVGLACLGVVVFISVFSPTLLTEGRGVQVDSKIRVYFFDSAIVNMVLPRKHPHLGSESIWHPTEYVSAAKLVVKHSGENDIVYSNLNILGYMIASLAGRPTANLLFTEVQPNEKFDPFLVSKIIVIPRDAPSLVLNRLIPSRHLQEIGRTKLFTVYLNPDCSYKAEFKRASLPFGLLWLILGLAGALLWIGEVPLKKGQKKLT